LGTPIKVNLEKSGDAKPRGSNASRGAEEFPGTDSTNRQGWIARSVFLFRGLGLLMRNDKMNAIKSVIFFLVFFFIFGLSDPDYLYAKTKKETIHVQPGPEEGMDSHIAKGPSEEKKNFGESETMGIGKGDAKRILIRFDIPSLPENATISSVQLQVCLAMEYFFDEETVLYLHRITGFWKEKEVSWKSNQDKRDWKEEGGDFDPKIETVTSLIGKTQGWISWDVTKTVKDFLDGKYVNFGFILKEHYCYSGEILFLSSDLGWEEYRPRLVISYETEEIPTEPVAPSVPSTEVFPNPFRLAEGHTEISFPNLPSGTSVKIFSIDGAVIRTVEEEHGVAKWDVKDSEGNKVSSGLYLYCIDTKKGRKTGKLVIIR